MTDSSVLDTVLRVTDGLSGVSVAQLVGGKGPKAARGDAASRSVRIGQLPSGAALSAAFAAGAWAFVPADIRSIEDMLPHVIAEVASGQCPVLRDIASDGDAAPALFTVLWRAGGESGKEPGHSPLSRGETEILARIARGHTSKRISKDLGFHVQTVKNKVTAILTKTGSRTRSQAAAIAQRNGWITVRPD